MADTPTATSCFSITPFIGTYIRRSFLAAALQLKSINIDDFTTLELWKPKTTNTDLPNLVLLHGFGPVAMWQWYKQLAYFSPHFNLYIPNLLFFGGSYTESLDRSEAFQAECIAKLMKKLGVINFSAVGTSYGGFVLYNLAKMHPEKLQKVVIASSAVNMVKGDNEDVAKRANVENVQDLMLPSTAANFRKLATLVVYNFPKAIPDFILRDLLRVSFPSVIQIKAIKCNQMIS